MSAARKIPPALQRFGNGTRGITREDMLSMTEHELAAFASMAPEGFTAIRNPADGTIYFMADWAIMEMQPSQRLELDIVGRQQ
jgi:hypothetical protein